LSCAPLRYLVVAHLECPDILVLLLLSRALGAPSGAQGLEV
jgi:hypothetical protein